MYKKQDIQKQRALEALMRFGNFCRVSGETGISKATLWAWLHEKEFLTRLIRMATCHWKRYHKTYSEGELWRVYNIGYILIWVKIHDCIFAEDSHAAEDAPKRAPAGQIPLPSGPAAG